jgi:hypothetical protein
MFSLLYRAVLHVQRPIQATSYDRRSGVVQVRRGMYYFISEHSRILLQ